MVFPEICQEQATRAMRTQLKRATNMYKPPPCIQTATGSSAVSSIPAGRMTFKNKQSSDIE